MKREYTYADNLREELNGLESADPDCMRKLLSMLDNALGIIADHERRLQAVEGVARQAANTASCLANGIRPD